MSTDTPWASPEAISRLSRQPFGRDLAALVSEKLRYDDGERGLWNFHRDYCGHGLIYHDAQYRLVTVHDGLASEGKILKAWDNSSAFVAWLERQSDYSLSGADKSEPELRPSTPSSLNNQRITRARLRDYVHDYTDSLAGFRDFVFAADLEFGFLAREYGFRKIRPRMNGRECVVGYRKLPDAGITIVTEFQSTPFITATLRAENDAASFSGASLAVLATDRAPDWSAPRISSETASESGYRQYFREYADLLRQHFPELLSPQSSKPGTGNAPRSAETTTNRPREAIDKAIMRRRISGVVIALAAFLLLMLELRYFSREDIPNATGSVRGNLGILLLMSLPWIALAVGILQSVSGASLRNLDTAFSTLPLRQRIGLGISIVAAVMVATYAATYVL